MKNGFLVGFDNSENEDVSGYFERMRGVPVVALRLRNAAEYRLPTFGPHGTKLGHSRFQ